MIIISSLASIHLLCSILTGNLYKFRCFKSLTSARFCSDERTCVPLDINFKQRRLVAFVIRYLVLYSFYPLFCICCPFVIFLFNPNTRIKQ